MLHSFIDVVYCLCFIVTIVVCDRYEIKMSTNAPVVLGGKTEFHADLYSDGQLKDGNYIFHWKDNSIPQHTYHNETKSYHSDWSATYPSAEGYAPGVYTVEVSVEWVTWINYKLTSKRMDFEVTGLLNGELLLSQNGTFRSTEFTSSAQDLNQSLSILSADMEYLTQNATYITTYWFFDCAYVGASHNLTSISKYLNENQKYDIEVLLVASFDPLPDPTTTTTTTTTTTATTTTTTTTTTPPTTTTPATTTTPPTTSTSTTPPTTSTSTTPSTTSPTTPSTTSPPTPSTTSPPTPSTTSPTTTTAKASISKRDISTQEVRPNQTIFEPIASSVETSTAQSYVTMPLEINQPFVCFNNTSVAPDPRKAYGYFHRQVIVKHPLTDITISGNLWLQYGEILNLEVKYDGSPPFDYCLKMEDDTYNITGNETCDKWLPTDVPSFPITHLFLKTHTIIIILRNTVAKMNKEVKVNIYEATKQSQLSVIVVPVVFCLVAMILVVFGVAYYMQNRRRFAVEVADFNFGETASIDKEYKTFRQRLVDSVRDLFGRRDDHGSNSSLEYGPMT